MAEYIEREWLMRKVNSFVANVLCRGHKEMITTKYSCNPHEWTRGYERGALDIANIVGAAPTEKVVEVVRCKDCAVPHNKRLGCPNLNGLVPPPNFYCANGERKMDGKGVVK